MCHLISESTLEYRGKHLQMVLIRIEVCMLRIVSNLFQRLTERGKRQRGLMSDIPHQVYRGNEPDIGLYVTIKLLLAVILRIYVQTVRYEHPCIDRKIIDNTILLAVESELELNRVIIMFLCLY